MPHAWIDDLVQPGRRLRSAGDGLLSALDPDDRASPYDRRTAMYDRVVGNSFYNRLVWGSSPASYAAFAAAAVAEGDGPLLDVGCGSAVFTAAAYRGAGRLLVLVDRSLAMLTRAAQRVRSSGHGSARIVFVQADLFDLPFRPRSFPTVACFGLLHLFDDLAATLAALHGQLAADGSLYVTSLVGETAVGRRALALLYRAGEAAPPRTESDVLTTARTVLGDTIHSRCDGSMGFLTARPRPTT